MNKNLAEGIGTYFLVLAGSGAAERLMGESLGLSLLAGTIAVAGVLYVFITLLGPVSGAHFNPAVSLAFRLKGAIDNKTLGQYILAQFAGAVLAAFSVHFMFGLPIFQLADPAPVSFGLGFSEALMTAGLIFVIFWGVRQNSTQIPAMVAGFVAAGYFMSSSSIVANPAVTLARVLTDGPTTIGMPKALVFILIQFAMAPLVVGLMRRV